MSAIVSAVPLAVVVAVVAVVVAVVAAVGSSVVGVVATVDRAPEAVFSKVTSEMESDACQVVPSARWAVTTRLRPGSGLLAIFQMPWMMGRFAGGHEQIDISPTLVLRHDQRRPWRRSHK